MPRPRPHPLAHTLAALLVLIAAFAYPLRLSPGAGGGELPTRAAESPGHGPDHPRAGETHHPALPTSHHAAHCLFCLTGAFALAPEPGVGLYPTGPAPTAGRSAAVREPHGPPSRVRARAPPLSFLL
ncbi:DUF2946 family protein [Deinococcus aestuarii]|uniref:DUF2946 family protein n=1 Tax=Deinococcus aestuarii TaxID=2774531 RepID=UPI001C0DFD66|nr:DUF2946 family protein [Deinococcus aestuarii]